MSRTPLRRFIATFALLVTIGLGPWLQSALAYSPATFTLAVKSAYLHSAPSVAAPRVNSAFKGQTYDITGRTADSAWVKLDFAGAITDVWALTTLGVISGDLSSVPVMTGGGNVPASTPQLPASTPQLPAPAPAALTPIAPVPTVQPAATLAVPVSASAKSLRFTITVKSAYLRSEPNWNAAKVGSAFQGQVYTAVGRSADSQWVQLLNGGTPTWAGAGVGQLNGAISTLAVPVRGKPATSSLPLPTGVPTITQHMRDIYSEAAKHGLNPFAFATVGDCNSESYIYLELAAANLINIPAYGNNLKETVGQFFPSFMRKSVAVQGSFNATSMFDPQWADPKQCQSDEGAFACELRVTQASIVFIALGTGDHLTWREFEQNYRRLIDYALSRGVLPVLVTKADDLEATPPQDATPGYINNVIRKLGAEYDVPLMDLDAATADFYNHALQKDGFHLDEFGIKAHVLLTVQTLDVIWRPN